MKLAVNFSNPLVNLIKSKQIKVDLIKCPDWEGMLDEALPYGPVTIHFSLEAGLGQTLEADFDRIDKFIAETDTPHVNTHLVTPRSCTPEDPTELKRVNEIWREEISRMVDHFGPNRVVLEHYPFTMATPYIAPAIDPAVFSKVITDTGCQFLLDLAHARITANTLGMDARDYIRALPVDRLTEMHVTGIRPFGGVLTDHFGMEETAWDVLDWALNEIHSGQWKKPRIVAFEYGGVGDIFVWRTDKAVIQEQVPRLYEMVHRND